MSFRDLPSGVRAVLTASRQLDPHHVLFLTYDPGKEGPPWELHAFKRWLVLRSDRFGDALEGVACALAARSAWLGKGPATSVPSRLSGRHEEIRKRLLEHLGSATPADAQASDLVRPRMARYRVVFRGLDPVYVKAAGAQDALERARAKVRTWRPDLALDPTDAKVEVADGARHTSDPSPA